MGKYAITHFRGDNYNQTFICRDKITLVPIDLTGSTLKFSIKKKETDTDYIYTGTSTIVNAVGGVAKISIPKSVTTLWQPGSWFYDIQITDSLGEDQTIIKDTFIITYDITR